MDNLEVLAQALPVSSTEIPSVPAKAKAKAKAKATQFHGFPDLPVEIRLMIWRFMSEPQIVHIGLLRCSSRHLRVSRPPVMPLYINQESRAYALSHFGHGFHKNAYGDVRHPVYVDFQRDIFHIPARILHVLAQEDLAQIRVFEIEWTQLVGRYGSLYKPDFRVFYFCGKLEKIILTVGFSFLNGVVVTTEEPDWAEKVSAFNLYPWTPVAARILRETWEDKMALLGAEFGRLRRLRPAWIPPKVIIKFFGCTNLSGFSDSRVSF